MTLNRYTPKGAILAGASKCKKKGHRGKDQINWCSRCYTYFIRQ